MGQLLQEEATGAGTFISREGGALTQITAEALLHHTIQPWSIACLHLDKILFLKESRRAHTGTSIQGLLMVIQSRALQGLGRAAQPQQVR